MKRVALAVFCFGLLFILGYSTSHSVRAEEFDGREDEYTEKCSNPDDLTRSELNVCSQFSEYLKNKNDDLQNDINATQDQLYTTMQNVQATQDQLAETEERITSVQAELEILNGRIAKLTTDIDAKEKRLADRMYVLQTYINGNELQNLLLSSENFDQLITRIQCIDEITTYDKELITGLIQDKADLEIQSAEAQTRYDDLFILQTQQTSLLMALNNEATIYQNDLNQNIAILNTYREDIGYIDASLTEAERRIKAEEDRKKAEEEAKLQEQLQQQNPSQPGEEQTDDPAVPEIPSGDVGAGIAASALSKVGCSYVYGGTGPDVFDCSGLAQWCYRQNGVYIPRTVTSQYYACTFVDSPEPGDLLFFNTFAFLGHVGIYIGNGQFVHAGTTATGVQIADFNSYYWQSVLQGIGRYR